MRYGSQQAQRPLANGGMFETSAPGMKQGVVQNRSMADLIKRNVKNGRLPYNYLVLARDVSGWFFSLAKADWVKPGQVYIND